MTGSHKEKIEQFVQMVNNRDVNHLDNVLDNNVEKKENSKTIYSNLQEAREFYSIEHETFPKSQFKSIEFKEDDSNKNTAHATITFGNNIHNITYTFNSDGKIQNIDSHLEQKSEE
ncbi:unnamed protein product [Adineta steineri]|uniref:Uncharacterized protein n=1 Tax=Adineta steineri TaxID=433720 RepID=A0A818VN10_9BILA|nr:unnamed protein product [Adineta steineri]CAF0913129.1 unnamed protein product [Adineta steineri]CAF3711504.1 unnamed protein product [Adineta steineri]CAF3815962.1 unnamed protein product [Adineta steineri]